MRKLTVLLVITFLGAVVVSSSQVRSAQEERFEFHERPEPMPDRNIELTITPVGYDERASEYVAQDIFSAGEQVEFALTMTNRMAERTVIGWGDVLFQTRVTLQKDGHDVSYLPSIADQLNRIDRHPYQGSSRPVALFPNKPQRISVLMLKNWYPPLEPGHYRLKVKHIFFGEERPIHSNEVTFDVVPQSNP